MSDKMEDILSVKRQNYLSAGWRQTKIDNPDFKCRQCRSNDVLYRLHESSDGAYDDYHYHCFGCGNDWWVESADY